MKVYERHLAREIYSATLLVLVAFLSLFAFFDLIHELEIVGKGSYEFHHALGYVALTLPGRAYEIFPIAVLIGTLYALTLLARHSEITVFRASGLATHDLLLTLAKIGSVFVVLTFLIGEFVAPQAERAGAAVAADGQEQAGGSGIPFRTVGEGWPCRSSMFARYLPDATLRGVRVYAFDANYRLRSISEAESGSYVPSGHWRLANVVHTLLRRRRRVSHRQDVRVAFRTES